MGIDACSPYEHNLSANIVEPSSNEELSGPHGSLGESGACLNNSAPSRSSVSELEDAGPDRDLHAHIPMYRPSSPRVGGVVRGVANCPPLACFRKASDANAQNPLIIHSRPGRDV